jgi:hypothetical protein
MRGVYSHVTPRMQSTLVNALQQMWEESIAARAELSPRSPLSMQFRPPARRRRGPPARRHRIKIGSQTAPEIGHPTGKGHELRWLVTLTC